MDLETKSRELFDLIRNHRTKIDLYREILSAFRSVAAEAREAALREALKAKPKQPMNEDFNKWAALWWLGVTDKEVSIRALLDAPPSDPDSISIQQFLRRKEPPADPAREVTVALAKLFMSLWNAGSDIPFPPFDWMVHLGLLEKFTDPTGHGYAITPLGHAALAVAEDGR